MSRQFENSFSFSETVASLSLGLDLTEGQPMGHALRSCMIGMRIAAEIGLTPTEKIDLYYALLLKDAGCSSNSSKLFHLLNSDEIRAKREVKTTDWTRTGWDSIQYAVRNVRPGLPLWERIRGLVTVAASRKKSTWELTKIRCERGASVARKVGLPEPVALAIHSLDEHWNGAGNPDGLRGAAIPVLSRIMNLAQTLDAYQITQGAPAAIQMAQKRSGIWFDPNLVNASVSLHHRGRLLEGLDCPGLNSRVVAFEPPGREIRNTCESLDEICEAFAEVVDAKSPFTYQHSSGVAQVAVAIATRLGLDQATIAMTRRAALLHDIGKLSVPNTILEKPAELDKSEWAVVKQHPFYTLEILRKIRSFSDLSEVAASHHEKLDGTGYFRHLHAGALSTPARIVAVADIYEALAARRPYREAIDYDGAFRILRHDARWMLDGECIEALGQGGAPMALQLTRLSGALTVTAPRTPVPLPVNML